MGLEHNLYKYGVTTNFTYSDMNGFGPFLPRVRSVRGVLGSCGASARGRRLPVLGAWHDVRLERPARASSRRRFTRPVAAVTALGAVAMVALGGFIFWNTNVLNQYTTTCDQQARQADYEKKYKALAADAAAEDRRGQARRRPLPLASSACG